MDAAAEAFAYAWKNWPRIEEMKNPAGYVYTIGRNAGRRSFRRPSWPTPTNDSRSTPWVEPGLPRALEQLTERQRVATVLIHGGEWTLAEVAELMSVDRGTVQKHADRGIAKLRAALEVNIDA